MLFSVGLDIVEDGTRELEERAFARAEDTPVLTST